MFEGEEIKTIGQYFNMKLFFSFLTGLFVGVLFTVPLVERGVLGTDFLANVIDKKVEKKYGTLGKEDEETTETKKDGPSLNSETLFTVLNQPAGAFVVVSMIDLSSNGWVAVHEETDEGGIGNILGARRFIEGKYFGSSIELLRNTEGGRAYYVVLHGDDGDSLFDFEKETPVKNSSGSFVSARFLTTPTFSE